jgi:hypothetical protein
MARTAKNLAQGQLAASTGAIYTAPAGTTVIVTGITLTNSDDASAFTANLYFVENGSAAADAKLFLNDKSLAAKETVDLATLPILDAGDAIHGDASSASKINYLLSGVLVT